MLGDRAILSLLGAEVVSNLGSRMTWLALPWFVLVTSGSATRMGIVFAVEAVPIAILGIPSGGVVQRFGARRTMLICDLARAPLIACVPLLHALHDLSFGLLLVLVFVAGVFTAPYFASQRLVLPEVVGEDERTLTQANSLLEGAQRFTGLAGPASAGALIGALGAANVIWIDAASYLVAFALIATAVPQKARSLAAHDDRALLAGVRFIAHDRVLAPIVLEIMIVGACVPLLFAGLPLLAYERYGRSAIVAGALASGFSAGALLGAFGAYRVVPFASPTRVAVIAAPWFALPLAALAFHIPAWTAVVALALSGFSAPFVNAPMFALLTLRSPTALRSKVMTTTSTAEVVTQPIGYALIGPVFTAFGIAGTYALVAGGLCLGVAILMRALLRAGGSLEPAEALRRPSARPL